MMQNVIGQRVLGMVAALVIAIIAVALYPTLNNSQDEYYLEYQDHCQLNGENFLRAYAANADGVRTGVGTVITATASATTCTTTAITSSTGTVTEHEVRLSAGDLAAGAIAGSTWLAPLPVLTQNGGISRLIITIMPVIAIASVIILTGYNAFANGGSNSVTGITVGIIAPIAGLLVVIVALALAPTLMSFLNTLFMQFDGALSVNNAFGTVLRLLVGFTPVVFNAGLIGASAVLGIGGAVLSSRMGRNS